VIRPPRPRRPSQQSRRPSHRRLKRRIPLRIRNCRVAGDRITADPVVRTSVVPAAPVVIQVARVNPVGRVLDRAAHRGPSSGGRDGSGPS
jgi:hypothetical protein